MTGILMHFKEPCSECGNKTFLAGALLCITQEMGHKEICSEWYPYKKSEFELGPEQKKNKKIGFWKIVLNYLAGGLLWKD